MSDVATLTAEKQAATALFQEGKLAKARDAYFAILIDIDSCCEETTPPDPAKVEIKIACLNNLMALFLKTKKFKEVIELSRQVLLIDSKNVKAYFRQSQALSELEMNNDAYICLQKLLLIEPKNAQAKELLYVVMDKLNPLDEGESLPSPPPPGPKKSEDGKVYNISRMPVATNSSSSNHINSNRDSSTSSDSPGVEEKEEEFKGVEPVPVTFGGGWDFMNPQWTPAGDDEIKSKSEKKESEQEEKEDRPTLSGQQVANKDTKHEDKNDDKTEDKGEEDTAQIFLDEAERTRIKNQLFAEALQKNSKQEIKNIKNKSKSKKNSSSNHQREVAVDEIVSKTVEELSLEEKKLVARVESKKAKSSQKISTKTKKDKEGSTLKKKKVVSTKAKSEWEMMLMEEEENIRKCAASKASTIEAAKAAAAKKLK